MPSGWKSRRIEDDLDKVNKIILNLENIDVKEEKED